MHLGFLGFGLIAGSVARAVRANAATADWTMAAWSPTGSGPASALAEGIIDRASPIPVSALDGADVVVLGAPATACLELIDRLAGPWRDRLPGTAVVTDVASTKARLVERADAVGLRFVGGHPMAGLERTGFAASDADLFRDRPWILVQGALASPADVARVEAVARACSARPIVMDAGAHDRAVAGISHLPLVTAVALVEAVTGATEGTGPGAGPAADWPAAVGLSAGGWRDMTRLARGDPAMGASIVATNAEALAARVRDLRAALDAWLVELERVGGPDEAAVTRRLETARAVLEREP
jgi:prephenate dehydrogenase